MLKADLQAEKARRERIMHGIPAGVEIPSVRPMNGQILVYLEPEADKFSEAPSLIKPSAVKSDHVFRIGRVVRKGPGEWNKKKTVRKRIMVEVGARVVFVKFVATSTKTAEAVQHTLGKDFALLRDTDCLLEIDDDVKMEDIGQ
jgi:co-chaperonin GroES (HSP10)